MLGQHGKRIALTNIIIILVLISLCASDITNVSSQTNLIEEDDHYKIFAGNYYNLIIPKNAGPMVLFDIPNLGQIKVMLSYISEYFSPTPYLSSLDYLDGKGYSLGNLNWDLIGLSDAEKTYVNFTKTNLDRNTSIDLSYIVFNDNLTYNGYDIQGLKNTYFEMKLNDWIFSEDTKGIAFNIKSSFESTFEYNRYGPFHVSNKDQYIAKLLRESSEFELLINSVITLVTTEGYEVHTETTFFANYNIAAQGAKPLDMWISVPYRANIKQIKFNFLCGYKIESTESISIASFVIFSSTLVVLTFATRVIFRRWKK